ncbi:Solute carrier organic anion transporter, member [Desmophyllum pertusum]|uniref:Solute carrier organic anion transporter, member n=1 Tax=Desmophyllum pertusum TaxID=174260 RepID=A0A9W9YIU3_9CNID|nr:Solute carrier organic anion transporter, member [Desmophyllum pertusum]
MRVVKAEHRHSNQSDEDREPRISVKEDSGEVSSMHESESSSKAESESDSESQIYSEISGSVEKTEVTGRGVFGSLQAGCRLRTVEENLRRYQSSMLHSYISTENPDGVNVDHASIKVIEEKARLWSTSYKKDSQRRHLQKQDEDLSNLISPQMVAEFEQSESVRRTISLIGQLSGAHSLEVNQAAYTLIRDFILTEITISNAHRSGVLANMTMGEYKKVKLAGNSHVISVSKHKTADVHGPAWVVLSPTLFGYLKVFVDEVRRVVSPTKEDDDPVILSWNGARLVSGQISTAINAAWKKGGMTGHVCSTLFRKSVVSVVHANHKEMKGNLADLMAHKESTAQRYYRPHEKQQSCIQAAADLPSIMRASNTAPEEDSPTTKENDEDPIRPEDSKDKQRTWNEQEIAAIKELFCEEIKEKSITMAVIREKIKDHHILHNQDPKRVCDKVRNEWRDNDKNNCMETGPASKPTRRRGNAFGQNGPLLDQFFGLCATFECKLCQQQHFFQRG